MKKVGLILGLIVLIGLAFLNPIIVIVLIGVGILWRKKGH